MKPSTNPNDGTNSSCAEVGGETRHDGIAEDTLCNGNKGGNAVARVDGHAVAESQPSKPEFGENPPHREHEGPPDEKREKGPGPSLELRERLLQQLATDDGILEAVSE